MALKRRIKKYTGSLSRLGMTKYLVCKECHCEEVEVTANIVAVTCSNCVQRMLPPPEFAKKKVDGDNFPRGWHFKARYVHTDGTVYTKGVRTDETDTPDATTPKKKKIVKKTTKKGKTK